MALTGIGLVNYVKSKLGTPYVYGAKMELLTQAKYDYLKKTYGSMVWDSDKSKIGKVCCDCSGLISAYTGVVQGSAQMKAAAIKCQPISTIKDAPLGAILWKDGHVGVYIGNGEYIAEDGSAYGCRQNKISNASFTHWLLMSYIDYSENMTAEQAVDLICKKCNFNSPQVWKDRLKTIPDFDKYNIGIAKLLK